MKPELRQKLRDKYRALFPDYLREAEISCGDGWYTILDVLCYNIKEHQMNRNGIVSCTPVQIKEKFGGLRFYADHTDDKIDGMIRMAEAMSLRMCEHCGSVDDLVKTEGWIKTLCEGCADNWRYRKEGMLGVNDA